MPTRAEMWKQLEGPVDLLVVGGGITGVGIARDAARRGLRTALVEMRDLAFGTSSRSSKLVHGGLRYLEQYEFSLVFEAVSERRILMDIAPHLVNPLGFLFPVYKSSRRGLWMINAGMWLYDGLSLFRSPKLHRTLKPAEVRVEEPALEATDLTGAPLYYDCATDDARLTLETALDAVKAGATVVSHAKVTGFLKDDRSRITGVVVQDAVTGELKQIQASAVVNATGPWTDRTIAMSGPHAPLLRPTKGVHIVVPRAKLPVQHAVVAMHPKDGRVLFAIPWGDASYVGTTDTDWSGDPAEVWATSEDVDYLIAACAAYFPKHPLDRADVLSTWAGLRPLMAPPSAEGQVSESKVSREHSIVVGQDGLVTIAGGKLTTYRRMAAEVVDTAINVLRLGKGVPKDLRPSDTDQAPLPGAVGWPEDDDHGRVSKQIEQASEGRLDGVVARYLADTYGTRGIDLARRVAKDPTMAEPLVPGRPEIAGQADWAVAEELAVEVSDVMVRRTQLYYRAADQGLAASAVVGRRMAKLLGWDDAQTAASVGRYAEEVALSRRWRG
jgi:glycerol-3-phosphate dehydrogenase